jgi:hypothetical protein
VGKTQTQHSKTETFTLSQIRQAQSTTGSGTFALTLPRFQRGVVWQSEQKKRLIDSIFNGFPVGALLGFHTGDKESGRENPREIIQLVDGLQRTTTIVEYLQKPLLLSPRSVLFSDDQIKTIIHLLGLNVSETTLEEVGTSLEAWAEATEKPEIPLGFTYSKVLSSLQSIPSLASQDLKSEQLIALETHINLCLQEILDDLKEIENVRVPLITYVGPQENVSEVFERINTQGIKLSKYERFAATWIKTRVHITNDKIRAAIEAKYKALLDAGYDVMDLGPDNKIPQDEFNLFEYLFGLGKVLSKKYEFLFPKSSKPDESPAIAFVIATIAHGLKVSQMGKLDAHLQGASPAGAPLDFSKFESAVFAACDLVQGSIKKFLKLNLNTQSSKTRFLPHSQNQIISLVVRMMLAQNDWKNWTPINSQDTKTLAKNIPSFYLMDILRGQWSGSGDSRLWDVCWDAESSTDSGPTQPSDHYLSPPTSEDWTATLLAWHKDQLGKRQTVRPNVSPETKVLLKFIYSGRVTVADDEGEKFDLEHLYPVDVLSKALKASGSDEGWPFSAAGNLSLLPATINRIKGKTMLGDYLETPKGLKTPKSELKKLKTYVIKPDLVDLKKPNELTKDDYVAFCESRFEALIKDTIAAVNAKPAKPAASPSAP